MMNRITGYDSNSQKRVTYPIMWQQHTTSEPSHYGPPALQPVSVYLHTKFSVLW